jgi:hypothetical protein
MPQSCKFPLGEKIGGFEKLEVKAIGSLFQCNVTIYRYVIYSIE